MIPDPQLIIALQPLSALSDADEPQLAIGQLTTEA
jgi:hypothetical protein